MITPEEKAKELVKKFQIHEEYEYDIDVARECALICVDEIIESLTVGNSGTISVDILIYYKQVKSMLEKL